MKTRALLSCLWLLCAPAVAAGLAPVELGRVAWGSDLDAALAAATRSGRPVLVLFQEVPGCRTCQEFGQDVLSHPLLVEAAEELFHPVLIFNNRPGADARLLERFAEPAWNNPVVRYLDANGADLVPRRERVWSRTGTAERMVEALAAAGREVPEWLRQVAIEGSGALQTVTFTMHCFWEGEGRLGGIEGVVATRAGWLDGREVVEVTYDPNALALPDLAARAAAADLAAEIQVPSEAARAALPADLRPRARVGTATARDAAPGDRKHTLCAAPLAHLPMTASQATKVNAALHAGTSAARWLSPRQRQTLERIEAALALDPAALGEPPADGGELVERQARLVERLARVAALTPADRRNPR